MSIQIKNGRTTLAMAICVALLALGNEATAQPGTQGSDTTNQVPDPGGDPFQGLDDEKFELPGVPPLPGEEGAAPQAVDPRIGRVGTFQTETVNDKYVGWRQVSDGTDGNRLSEILRSQWVMVDDVGSVRGIVYGVEGADVGNLKITLLHNGRVVTSTRPKDDGTFNFSNVREGTYAVIGWGDNAFFAFGLNILRFNEEADDSVPQELKITAVPNETTINTDWIKYFAKDVKFPIYGKFEIGEDESDPPRLYGLTGQSLFLPAARPATSISSHLVTPTSDGRLIGRVHQMSTRDGRPIDLRNTRVMLLQNDDVYAAVSTDAYGVFEFPELPAGEYACVAVGQDGIGCIGIYLGEAGSGDEDFAPLSFTMIPSETTGWLHDLAIEQAYLRVISRPIVDYNEDEQCSGCGQTGGGCQRPYALRPGGYRVPPKSAIPRDQYPLKKFNRLIDGLFFRDAQIPPTGGGYYGTGYQQNFSGNPGFSPTPVTAPGPIGGSTSRNPVPAPSKR